MSKPAMRKRLAALSFSEKIKILEKLRDRSLALADSGLGRRDNEAGNGRETGQIRTIRLAGLDGDSDQ